MIVNLKKYFKFDKLEKCKTWIIEIIQNVEKSKVYFHIQLEQAFYKFFSVFNYKIILYYIGQEKKKKKMLKEMPNTV